MKAHVAPLAFTLVFIMVWLGYFRATWRRDMLVGRLRALAESLGLAQAPVEPS
jgi:hypothetical protein